MIRESGPFSSATATVTVGLRGGRARGAMVLREPVVEEFVGGARGREAEGGWMRCLLVCCTAVSEFSSMYSYCMRVLTDCLFVDKS